MRPSTLTLMVVTVTFGVRGVSSQQVVTTSAAVLRRDASSQSPHISSLPKGDTLQLLDTTTSHHYYHVRDGSGLEGWVVSSRVQRLSSAIVEHSGSADGAQLGDWTDSLKAWAKPPYVEVEGGACVAVGKGNGQSRVDSATDLWKNRIDSAESYHALPLEAVLALPWQGVPTRRYRWSANDSNQVAQFEGVPVVLEGYLGGAKEEQEEATNCELPQHAWHDWHVWLVPTDSEGKAGHRERAVVVEVTPRVRASHAKWVLATLQHAHTAGTRVRISGWLMFDPDHPDQVGKTRGTTWEVHPIMKIALWDGQTWRNLDDSP